LKRTQGVGEVYAGENPIHGLNEAWIYIDEQRLLIILADDVI
jgi:hypothetical protein